MPNLLMTVVISIGGLLHPFHISICEINHNDKDSTLQITARVFQDDFEVALTALGTTDGFFTNTPEDEANRMVEEFFGEHLQVSVDSKPVEHQFLGFEIDNNVVWCYLEIQKIQSMKVISLKYSVLMDTFEDQINLAHIRYQGDVKSLRFHRDQLTGTAAFTN